jgi:hypothetical protein
MRDEKISGLTNGAQSFYGEAPQMLPWKFTDEDMITVPIPYEDEETTEKSAGAGEEKKSFMSRLGRKLSGAGEKDKQEKFKMVRMTRGEYLAKWARDEDGKYIGTDPVPGKLKR